MTGAPPPGPRSLALSLARVTRGPLRHRGFVHTEIVSRWPEIAGALLARASCPERLTFPPGASAGATLQLRVAGSMALQIQHHAPLIIERINAFYGYRAVARLKLVQGPLPPPPRRRTPPPRALGAAEEAALAALVAATDDAALRQTLASLGRSILSRRTRGHENSVDKPPGTVEE